MRCVACLFLVFCLTQSGCAVLAVGSGAAGVAYLVGDIERTYPYPIDVVWEAFQAALVELQLPPGYQAKDQLTGRIERHTAAGDKIKIKLDSRGQFTDVKVRVNVFGNKSMSLTVVQTMERYLPPAGTLQPVPTELPPQPIPEGPSLPPSP